MSSKKINKEKEKTNNKVIALIKEYWPLLLMNVIIFVLTIFVESLYIYKMGQGLVIINTVLFVMIPTIIFTALNKVKSRHVAVSVPMLYILFLIFLDYCTAHDLYGITSSRFDVIPNFIDALLVVFIFVFIEYLSSFITMRIKELLKR